MVETKDIEQKKIDWIQKYYEIQVRCIEANLKLADSYASLYKSQRNYLEWVPKFARLQQRAVVAVVIFVAFVFLFFVCWFLGRGDTENALLFVKPWIWFEIGFLGCVFLYFGFGRLADKIANEVKKKGLNLSISGTYKLTTYCSVDGKESSSEYSFVGRKD